MANIIIVLKFTPTTAVFFRDKKEIEENRNIVKVSPNIDW